MILMHDDPSRAEAMTNNHLPLMVVEHYPLLVDFVRYACLKRHYFPIKDEVEDLREQIVVLLLNNDCQRLKTFDSDKASFKTWLTKVVDHHVSAYLKQRKTWHSLAETLPEKLLEQPKQELNVITQEQRIAVAKEIEKLSEHQRRLLTLICDDLPVTEIAERLKIKPESIHRMKHQIIQKIRAGLKKETGGGANFMPNTQIRKIRIIKNNKSRFCNLRTIFIQKIEIFAVGNLGQELYRQVLNG